MTGLVSGAYFCARSSCWIFQVDLWLRESPKFDSKLPLYIVLKVGWLGKDWIYLGKRLHCQKSRKLFWVKHYNKKTLPGCVEMHLSGINSSWWGAEMSTFYAFWIISPETQNPLDLCLLGLHGPRKQNTLCIYWLISFDLREKWQHRLAYRLRVPSIVLLFLCPDVFPSVKNAVPCFSS